MQPRISVVTPSYNQGEYLETTILSVLGQAYPALEYIIIDGGSSDASVEVIQRYAHEIAYWESVKDRGQSHAINKGFARATGEIVSYLNSDDCYTATALQTVGEYFRRHTDCMWLCGNVLFTDVEGKVLRRKRPVYGDFILRFAGASIYQPAVFVRRHVLDTVGLLREDFHAVMDLEWFCRIAERFRPHFIDSDLALFRWHPTSKSSSQRGSPHELRYLKERAIVASRFHPQLSIAYERFPRLMVGMMGQIARVDKLWKRLAVERARDLDDIVGPSGS